MSRRGIHKEIISDLLEESGLTQEINLNHLTDCLIGHFESIEESDRDVFRAERQPMAEITQTQFDEVKEWQRKACCHIVNLFAMSGKHLDKDEIFDWVKNSNI